MVDFGEVDFDRDVVFTWNGTTSGCRVPEGAAIPADRAGLTICDATSAAFAQRLPWDRLDVVTFSWQKAMGGEAAHGMIVLSPRAVERLLTFVPPRPLPKIFRMVSGGELIEGIFKGDTINTPVHALRGGLHRRAPVGPLGRRARGAWWAARTATPRRSNAWVRRTPWIANLAETPAIQSNTSVCLRVVDPAITQLSEAGQAGFAKAIAALLEREGVAHDIASYRDAPAGLRVWCGATVETADVEALTDWLDWAYAVAKAEAAG